LEKAGLFSGHHLHQLHSVPVLHESERLIWVSFFFILNLAALAILNRAGKIRFGLIVRGLIRSGQASEREDTSGLRISTLILYLLFIFNTAYMGYRLNSIHPLFLKTESPFLQLLFISGLMLFFLLARLALNAAIAAITDSGRFFSQYTTLASQIAQACGVLLFPLFMLSEFTLANPLPAIWIALVILSTGTIVKWYKALVLALFQQKIGILPVISYFCGLEILPMLVLAKFAIERF
jgi:hypothetical protein